MKDCPYGGINFLTEKTGTGNYRGLIGNLFGLRQCQGSNIYGNDFQDNKSNCGFIMRKIVICSREICSVKMNMYIIKALKLERMQNWLLMPFTKRFRTIIILAVMGALCVNGCHTVKSGEEMKTEEIAYMKISAEDAKEIMDSTDYFVLVDVREEDEYASGHIAGALFMPYGEIKERAETELMDKEQTILVYCRSGRRSAIAAQTLAELGYTDVRDFGGIIDWGYDIETD